PEQDHIQGASGRLHGPERRPGHRDPRGPHRPGRTGARRHGRLAGATGFGRHRTMNSPGDTTMTVNNANRPRTVAASVRAGAFGLAVGLLSALGAASAAPASAVVAGMAQAVPVSPLDPAKQLPGRLQVADIDFSRGEGGSGKLTLRFDGAGAMADLRNEGSRVVVQVPNASVPA